MNDQAGSLLQLQQRNELIIVQAYVPWLK